MTSRKTTPELQAEHFQKTGRYMNRAAAFHAFYGQDNGEKAASKRDAAHLGLAAVAALGSAASAVGANRAASVREKELAMRMKKRAMWDGFDKCATVFNIPHGEGATGVMAKLRHLLGKPAIAHAIAKK